MFYGMNRTLFWILVIVFCVLFFFIGFFREMKPQPVKGGQNLLEWGIVKTEDLPF